MQWYLFYLYALLGYSAGKSWHTRWLCGGSLISDKFILTAGHCLMGAWDYGELKCAVLGTTERSKADANIANRYTVKREVFHKDYHSNFYHHDIGLVETKEQVKLSKFIVPACLHFGDSVEDDMAYSIGWGSTIRWTSTNDELRKITLTKSTIEESSLNHPPTHDNGNVKVNDTVQLCYGDKTNSDGICMSTSGSPLQMKNKNLNCMQTVIGVTSITQGCVYGAPGIYFRVSYYLPWIESVVWP